MNFSYRIVCVVFYFTICASAHPIIADQDTEDIPVEVAMDDRIYLLPNILKENDEILMTGTIENTTEWWWAVRLTTEASDIVVCEIKGNKTSNTITVNSLIEDSMEANVFLNFTFVINLKLSSVPRESTKNQFSIKFGESIVEQTCKFDTDLLKKIKYIVFDGSVQKIDVLRFKLA